MAVTIKTEVTINQPVEVTFTEFTDFQILPRILHQAIAVDFISEHHQGINTEWEQAVQEDENTQVLAIHKITEFTNQLSFTMTSDDVESFETMVFQFSPIKGGTRVSFQLTVNPKRLIGKIALPLFKGQVKKYMEADLNRMKSHIEAKS